MAATVSNGAQQPLGNGAEANTVAGLEDPFTAGHVNQHPHPHRYSAFDTQLFSLNAASSPGQIKRTIEAHIAETDRRLGDASKLGTTLLEQRRELQEKLQEVEKQQDDAELSPELRERLRELEKEYNEVGRDSARAILAPRSRVVSAEEPAAASPAHFSTQATASPTKVTAPTRKQRNQPSSRVGDIQFAADISTSLLAQVRQLQAVLAEREEALKQLALEKSKLELEAEGFNQRLRALDENEQRYKDENWNLETQTHELLASVKDSSDREKKLNATLAAALAEKSRAQNELDELKLAHGKLSDDHSAAQKTYDSELHALRRIVDVGDAEKLSLQNRIEELTSQNQELAKAVAARLRAKEEGLDEYGLESEDLERDMSTPENSPPPSPTKGTPRHPGLESETLKSSLHHAHRMIQNLKGNIHREKTEKIELKRMLQEARDELEARRGDANLGSGSKRQKNKADTFKKPSRPDMLGGSRRIRTDVELEEAEWQDHDGDLTPSRSTATRQQPGAWPASVPTTDLSDAYQTANDTDAFETANERGTGTESEAFQTVDESMAGESTDELTETEERGTKGGRGGTIRAKRPEVLSSRMSFQSTASTSADEDQEEIQTPVQTQPQKYRLRLSKFINPRRSRSSIGTPNSAHSSAKNSPASFYDKSPPAQGGQSLFAELGGAGSDGEFSTPGRSSVISPKSTPGGAPQSASKSVVASPYPEIPSRPQMVDSAMMTEPWVPEPAKSDDTVAAIAPSERSSIASLPPLPSDFPLPPSHPGSPGVMDSSTQYTPLKSLQESPSRGLPTFITPPKTVWDEEQETSPPAPAPASLSLSQLATQETHPVDPDTPTPVTPMLAYSGISAQEVTPVEPEPLAIVEARPATAKKAEESRPSTAQKTAVGAGLLGSVGAALGLKRATDKDEPIIAEDQADMEGMRPQASSSHSRVPLQDISGNVANVPAEKVMEKPTVMNDQGAQTLLTSAQIDKALMDRVRTSTSPVPATVPLSAATYQSQSTGSSFVPPSPAASSRGRSLTTESQGSVVQKTVPAVSTPRRPGSSSSVRQSLTANHPPLPPDHKQAIVAAGGRLPSDAKTDRQIMGPPIAPASAYKRPQTPGERSIASPTRGGTTPRPRGSRAGATSQLSRRSSVSSFASELDERFNIHANALPGSHTFEPGTDPRMIQAITQTMIGEFLWKYTRKPGRGDMSSTRHRRYFWVHPYTKTLYWSDQDPQTAGRSELKAKSVAIEAVRVVTDDNPMPPGLHRKSIEVITPGRKIKFTASTGQRHETWFNALSYLLLRNQEDGNTNGVITDPTSLTAEDVDEFNPGVLPSRISLSSYNSRTTQNTAIRTSSRLSARQSSQMGDMTITTPTLAVPSNQDSVRKGSISRLSNMFRNSVGYGRLRSDGPGARTPGEEGQNGIYNASLVEDKHDSAEDLRKEMLQQERDSDRLENVRACCDGK
ncbi:putative anucleate primary sterigmata protein a [Phaeomoniella chlamydospora]|uniref:Putative anucleate primary sterigmata protein a n=1 Tax=Phaeomoniella chlamydospora TaxID=158046 RepID=A0A0G2HAL0_PHACM|nr:putative anucleate primary sterigmata protein a [Phaeomoniella chlamydospora]